MSVLALLRRKEHLVTKEVDPNFDQLLSVFQSSQAAFANAEDMFWKLRVQNEELKILNRALRDENEMLREQLDSALRQSTQPQ